MSALLIESKSSDKSVSSQREDGLFSKFASRQSSELVIAFAGPIGCGIKSVINITRHCVRELGYTHVEIIKLSDFLEGLISKGVIEPPKKEPTWSNMYYRYRRLQEVGRLIREKTSNNHILAEYAVQQILLHRESYAPVSADPSAPSPLPGRVAYLIDQVKRPEEVALLRALYRNLFYLVGVTKPFKQRERFLLEEGVEEVETAQLIDIDKNEGGDGGQQLDRTLHLADFFVRNDALLDQRNSMRRFIRLIHGDKGQTPDRLEQGMYAAFAAGLRSACLSRQVGAAIANKAGEIIATGCNDVPAPMGGLYGSNQSVDDARCLHHPQGARCFNDLHKRELQADIAQVVDKVLQSVSDEEADRPVILSKKRKDRLLNAIYKETRLGSLIEFSRSVHAEMDAIVSLARSGGETVRGGTLYSTTFPCHSCARHIVAAGICEVYYIEPYEKSMAQELHGDAIQFENPDHHDQADGIENKSKVKFLHFEGVSPRLFTTLFRADGRKDKKEGKFIPLNLESPEKVLPEYLDNYKDFELRAVKHLQDNLKLAGLE